MEIASVNARIIQCILQLINTSELDPIECVKRFFDQ
jgi:hypothetical protein